MGIWDLWSKKSSKDFAKDRLKLLLVSDRVGCSAEVMELMKNDIISVISKYVDIDQEELDIQITKTESENHSGMVPVMVANIPIRDIKHKGL